jgi:electron transfer flavoprotein beta subunit
MTDVNSPSANRSDEGTSRLGIEVGPTANDAVAPIVVCMKWVSLRPDIDPLSGAVASDERWSGASAADLAALELALQIGEQRKAPVVVITVGPSAAEPMLRDALSCGASVAHRIDTSEQREPKSDSVAQAIGAVVSALHAQLVMCGDWSLDRGSGSVPVFLAAELGVDHACGLVALQQNEKGLRVERRLDGGRREVLHISGPAVLSVEGSIAHLRRANIRATLAAKVAPIAISHATLQASPVPIRSGPFRPRARVLDGPASDASPRTRVEELTGALTNRTPPQRVILNADEAAQLIISKLAEWGYELPVHASTQPEATNPESINPESINP